MATVGLAALGGLTWGGVLAIGVGTATTLAIWVAFDYPPLDTHPGLALAWVSAVLVALFASIGSVPAIEGPLESWYSNLDFAFVNTVSIDRFALGLCAALFLLATANRIVRLVLTAAVTSWQSGERVLAGGRLLGPMERIIVAAAVLAGDPAAAAIVIAAKGLLRFPEIRADRQPPHGPDAATEYFLIGTFTSLLLATALSVLILAIA